MKEEYAIERLKMHLGWGFSIGTVDAIKLGITALQRQIPMKPILKNGESTVFVDYADGHGEHKVTKWQDWVCPVCGWFVGQRYNGFQKRPHDQRKSNYCNECGQRIDWSETDEEFQTD